MDTMGRLGLMAILLAMYGALLACRIGYMVSHGEPAGSVILYSVLCAAIMTSCIICLICFSSLYNSSKRGGGENS